MQGFKGRTVRAVLRLKNARSAGRLGIWGIGIGAIAALALAVQVRAAQRDDADRRALAEAAALDRRSRDDQLRVWRVALNADPSSAMAMAQLAGLNIQKARETGSEAYYPVAESLARQSLALRTDRNAKTYVVLASALLAQHRFVEARGAAAAAHELEPEVAQYRALLAEIDMELGDYGAAAQGFTGLGRYRAHLSIGPRLARWEEVNGNVAAAREILETLTVEAERRRDLPREQLGWFYFRLGDHYRRHGSPRRARRAYARALDVNPGDYRAYKGLSELELSLGKTAAAQAHARAAVERSRTPETLLALANSLRQAGDTVAAGAIETEVATEIGPEGGTFERAWQAYQLEWRGSSSALVDLLERESRERGDVQGYDLLAWAQFKAGRLPQARAAISSALRSGTSDASVWYHAGLIFRASGDGSRARAYLREALRLNPRFDARHAGHARSVLRELENASS